MQYDELLKILGSSFSKILVTGCQRSGTKFAAWALSEDLGYRFADEKEIHYISAHNARLIFNKEDRIVLQAPAISSYIAEISTPDIAIVWVLRNKNDVEKSQKRINWLNTSSEQHEWNTLWSVYKFGQDNGALPMGNINRCEKHGKQFDKQCPNCSYEKLSIYDIKNRFWNNKHGYTHNPFELEYESMSSHRLWVKPENRDPSIVGLQK